jgi:hypothetical protein
VCLITPPFRFPTIGNAASRSPPSVPRTPGLTGAGVSPRPTTAPIVPWSSVTVVVPRARPCGATAAADGPTLATNAATATATTSPSLLM